MGLLTLLDFLLTLTSTGISFLSPQLLVVLLDLGLNILKKFARFLRRQLLQFKLDNIRLSIVVVYAIFDDWENSIPLDLI